MLGGCTDPVQLLALRSQSGQGKGTEERETAAAARDMGALCTLWG